MKYQPPFDPGFPGPSDGIYNSDPDASYVNGNPATGMEGSIPPAEIFEHPSREIVEVINWSGQMPDHTDLEQLRKALQWYFEGHVVTNAGGTPVYEGVSNDAVGKHKIRPLIPGTNVTFDLVENPPESGRYGIRINANAGELGEGEIALDNVGEGAQIYKGLSSGVHQLRSVKGINGINATQVGDEIVVDGAALSPDVFNPALRAPDVILMNQRAAGASPAVAPVAGTWSPNVLNDFHYERTAGIISLLGSGQVQFLAAGTYLVRWNTHQMGSDDGQSRIRNVTTNTVVGWGLTIGQASSQLASQTSVGAAVVTVSLNERIALEQFFEASGGVITWGDPSDISGAVNVYGALEITKIS
jgi:hypothetical protein